MSISSEARSLYQLRIVHAHAGEEIFTALMGDIVEPGREFTQDNALKVVNRDV